MVLTVYFFFNLKKFVNVPFDFFFGIIFKNYVVQFPDVTVCRDFLFRVDFLHF